MLWSTGENSRVPAAGDSALLPTVAGTDFFSGGPGPTQEVRTLLYGGQHPTKPSLRRSLVIQLEDCSHLFVVHLSVLN